MYKYFIGIALVLIIIAGQVSYPLSEVLIWGGFIVFAFPVLLYLWVYLVKWIKDRWNL